MAGSHSHYEHRYPRQGEVALLCEGDVAGFEVDLLEKWTIDRAGILVDVWSCGTKNSFFGLSDAIGRSRPIAVIEDRDFRSIAVAEDSCKTIADDRKKRAVNVRFWRTWNRNEIENYVIEPEVLVPVLGQLFDLSHDSVLQRLQAVISALAVDQAVQWAIQQFRCLISNSHPQRYIAGLPRNTHRPKVDVSGNALLVPDRDSVLNRLKEEFALRKQLLLKDQGNLDGSLDELIAQLTSRIEEWNKETVATSGWRIDWAGKDVLELICRWLAAERGWFTEAGTRSKIEWDSLKRETKSALERQIATSLQPHLVASMLGFLKANPFSPVGLEWQQIADELSLAPD